MSVPSNFALALVGGLSANIGLMHLTAMHKGCANVCTLCQFLFGLFDGLTTPVKRRALSRRQLSMFHHCVFAFMFFLGPFLGNLAVTVTNQDFYPVFLVVRSCGSAAAMSLGWGLANRHYSPTQVGCVISATVGAGIATLGCYQATSKVPEGAVTTSGAMFLVGLGLLIGNLLNDAGLAVYQAHVFDQHGKFVDEVVMMQGLLGSLLMSLVCGREAVGFIWSWIQEPVWYSVTDGILVPAELLFLSFNFVGNWNSKKRCTWLTANATAVISSLVPMLYRLISTLISTQLSGALILPAYTWLGILLVFVGSAGYLLANHTTATTTLNKSKSHKSLDEF